VFFPSFTALMMRLIWLIDKVLSPSAASTKGLISFQPSCCRTAVGVGQRALSLSAHTAGGPPPSGPGEGGVTTPYSRSIAGSTVTSLLRGSGGFSEREPQPLPSHRRSSSRALFPPPPSPVASVAWISERGADVVRLSVRRRL
jgi:hypothetical protein